MLCLFVLLLTPFGAVSNIGVPVFLSTPPSLVYISNGSDVQLSCSSSGHPRPIITWFRNKQPIREHIKPLPDSHHQSNTQQSDNKKKSGLSNSQYDYYTDIDVIKAKSSKSNKNKEAQNRKQIQSKNNNNNNNNNNNSSNSSDAREHFTYDNKRVNSVNSTLFIHHFTSPVLTPSSPLLPFFTPPPLPSPSSLSSSLFFPSSPTSTTPTFSCSATNPYGSVSHSFKILVPDTDWILFDSLYVSVPPRNSSLREGQDLLLHCVSAGFPTNITTTWFFNEQPLSAISTFKHRHEIFFNGSLFVSSLSSQDRGFYACSPHNVDDNESRRIRAFVDVTYHPKVVDVQSVVYLAYQMRGVLSCMVDSNPIFTEVRWFKDNQYLTRAKHTIFRTNNRSSLLIPSAHFSHQGFYYCLPISSLGRGRPSEIMKVLVRDPPHFVTTPRFLNQRQPTQSVTLTCQARGEPAPVITWKKVWGQSTVASKLLKNGDNLTIVNLSKEDHGLYQCSASNAVSSIVSSSLVIIELFTPHPPTNLTTHQHHSHSPFPVLLLTWLPAFDGGYPLHYLLWYRPTINNDLSPNMTKKPASLSSPPFSVASSSSSSSSLSPSSSSSSSSSPFDWETLYIANPENCNMYLHEVQEGVEYEMMLMTRNRLGGLMYSALVTARVSRPFHTPSIKLPSTGNIDNPKNSTTRYRNEKVNPVQFDNNGVHDNAKKAFELSTHDKNYNNVFYTYQNAKSRHANEPSKEKNPFVAQEIAGVPRPGNLSIHIHKNTLSLRWKLKVCSYDNDEVGGNGASGNNDDDDRTETHNGKKRKRRKRRRRKGDETRKRSAIDAVNKDESRSNKKKSKSKDDNNNKNSNDLAKTVPSPKTRLPQQPMQHSPQNSKPPICSDYFDDREKQKIIEKRKFSHAFSDHKSIKDTQSLSYLFRVEYKIFTSPSPSSSSSRPWLILASNLTDPPFNISLSLLSQATTYFFRVTTFHPLLPPSLPSDVLAFKYPEKVIGPFKHDTSNATGTAFLIGLVIVIISVIFVVVILIKKCRCKANNRALYDNKLKILSSKSSCDTSKGEDNNDVICNIDTLDSMTMATYTANQPPEDLRTKRPTDKYFNQTRFCKDSSSESETLFKKKNVIKETPI